VQTNYKVSSDDDIQPSEFSVFFYRPMTYDVVIAGYTMFNISHNQIYECLERTENLECL
jgi:hypothetical protein